MPADDDELDPDQPDPDQPSTVASPRARAEGGGAPGPAGTSAGDDEVEPGPPGVVDLLRGRRVLVTGVTGFLGEALLARLLSDLPETRVVVLVRDGGGRDATSRVAEVLSGTAFAAVRDREGVDGGGALLEALAGRLTVLAGDLVSPPALPGDTDVVVHCAGTVAFDPELDEGYAVNVRGVERLLDAVVADGARPHVVHVSTAFVQAGRQGPVHEEAVRTVPREEEGDAADALRAATSTASREPARLQQLLARAREAVGAQGPQAVAAHAEQARRDWVDEQMVEAGRLRAASLGFTDGYTLTKAWGEQAALERCGRAGLPLTVLRPSIVESAARTPHPGWIQGFKMAEPIILAFGRGDMPEFTAAPDLLVDVVPVDLVVNAMLVAAAHPPSPEEPSFLHVASGSRNPLSFGLLHRLVREYFLAHPLPSPDRGPVPLPDWCFPGPRAVERRLSVAERAQRWATDAVQRLPRSGGTTRRVETLERAGRRLRFLRRYLDLYRPYTVSVVVFRDDALQALETRLSPEDRERFPTDPAGVDWAHYLQEVHCPAVDVLVRAVVGAPRRSRPAVPDVVRREPDAPPVLAVFDLDGTLLPSNVVSGLLSARRADGDAAGTARAAARALLRAPLWAATERSDRPGFLRDVYRGYAGARLDALEALVDEELTAGVLARCSPAALRRVREHRAAGHRTVLVTGAVRPLTRPLAPLFDDVLAVDLETVDGVCTGHLAAPPLVGEARAAWVRDLAHRLGADLSASAAYADSLTDLPLLQAVGRPVPVSPDAQLLSAARRARWAVADWHARDPARDGRDGRTSDGRLSGGHAPGGRLHLPAAAAAGDGEDDGDLAGGRSDRSARGRRVR